MKTNLQTNEAPLSFVMTPMLAWQDVYTHNHTWVSDVSWEGREMRGEDDKEAETWWQAPGADCFSDFDRRTVATGPHWALRHVEMQRNGRGERETYLENREKHSPPPHPSQTPPRSPVWRKTIKSTHFPLSRSVDYKWANLAFITSLQTFIKAGSPPKLQR